MKGIHAVEELGRCG